MAPFTIIRSLLCIPHSVFRTRDINNTPTVLTYTSQQKGKAGSLRIAHAGLDLGRVPRLRWAGCRALGRASFLRLSVKNRSQTKQNNLLPGGWI